MILSQGQMLLYLSLTLGALLLIVIMSSGLISGITTEAEITPTTSSDQAAIAAQLAQSATDATTVATAGATTTPQTSDPASALTATAQAQKIAAAQTATAVALTSPPFPPCAVSSRALGNATACYAPDLEATLLESGYMANTVKVGGRIRLIASNSDKFIGVWSRDLDYAISGYSYVLDDMTVLRDSIELLLGGVKPDGVAPEGRFNNQKDYVYGTWDSAPNLIHAVYTYVAKTGDRDFYQAHRDTLQRLGMWIVALDSDNDGLPDHDIFPYGYYNSVRNSVQHTYALAKFYAAFNELAALERNDSQNGTAWKDRAGRLREAFHRPFDQGGYWRDDQPWPIAWRRGSGDPVKTLETFGVFEALRSGLIGPQDGARDQTLVTALHAKLPQLIDGPAPMRLALGGYDPDLIRNDVTPALPNWKLDANAPWIVGLAAPAYAMSGHPEDARTVLQAYMVLAHAGHMPRLIAGSNDRYGPGREGDGGTWDNAAWFLALYSGHYGLIMTPAALIVQPHPFIEVPNDGIRNLRYHNASVQLALDAKRKVYSIRTDQSIPVILRPMNDSTRMRVDAGEPQEQVEIELRPGHEYVISSEDGS